jgi:hypothetical protein
MRKEIFALAVFLVLAMAGSAALARAESNATDTNNSDKLTKWEEKKAQISEQRCKNIETRIETRINRYDNNQNRDVTVYANLKSRLDKLVERLKLRSLDTSKLETDLKTLDEKIAKAQTDYETFINGLKETQNLACGESQGQFSGKLGEARKVILTVRQDRIDIRNFLRNTIRPDIQALREKLRMELQKEQQGQSADGDNRQ